MTELHAGDKVGRLTVLGTVRRGTWIYAKTRCECGNEKEIRAYYVAHGITKSCGCLQRDHIKHLAESFLTKPKEETAFSDLYEGYKHGALVRNFEFDLSKEQARVLVKSSCIYCGRAPSNVMRNGKIRDGEVRLNGIDRLDSSKGYFRDNVVPCCWRCNCAKGDLSPAAFIQWIHEASLNLGIPVRSNVETQLIFAAKLGQRFFGYTKASVNQRGK